MMNDSSVAAAAAAAAGGGGTSSSTIISTSNHKFDMEHFSLLLAANLLGGREPMEKRLLASISSLPHPSVASTTNLPQAVSFSVYWRSPLLHPVDASWFWPDKNDNDDDEDDDGTTTMTDIETTRGELELLFLDATMVFQTRIQNNHDNDSDDDKSPKSETTLAFGALLRRCRRRHETNSTNGNHDKQVSSREEFYYIQGPAVTMSFWTHHMDQCGYVLLDTHARIIATSTANAFRRLSKGTLVHQLDNGDKDEARDDLMLHKVQIPLLYDDDNDNHDNHNQQEPSCHLEITNRLGPVRPLAKHVAAAMLLGMLEQEQQNKTSSQQHHHHHQQQQQQDNQTNIASSSGSVVGKEDSKQLLIQWEEWKQQAATWLEQCRIAPAAAKSQMETKGKSPTKPKAASPNNRNSKTSAGGNNTSKNNKDTKTKKNRTLYGVQRIGGAGKKKKQKTATFGSISEPN